MNDTTRIRINTELINRLRERLPDLDFMNDKTFVEYLLTNAIATQSEPGLQSLTPAPEPVAEIQPVYEKIKPEIKSLPINIVSQFYEMVDPKFHDMMTIEP